jgi:hypothetical protein
MVSATVSSPKKQTGIPIILRVTVVPSKLMFTRSSSNSAESWIAGMGLNNPIILP